MPDPMTTTMMLSCCRGRSGQRQRKAKQIKAGIAPRMEQNNAVI